MNVRIIATETVKPSSPTPHENRTYKLTCFDQLAPPMYTSIVLLYSPFEDFCTKTSLNDHLKTSLSKTLTLFYPYAGCFKGRSSIDCNDCGSSYAEADVDVNISNILENPDIDVIRQLLPSVASAKSVDVSERQILATQVNFFACGGVAIGLSIWHAVGDASSIAAFVKVWASVARGVKHDVKVGDVVIALSSLFPPVNDVLSLISYIASSAEKSVSPMKAVMKRFVFDGSKIAAFKKKIEKGVPSALDRPISRFEALCALIWAALITITQEKIDSLTSDACFHLALNAVNIRRKVKNPLSPLCMGNLVSQAVAEWPLNMTVDYNAIATKMRHAISMINDESLDKLDMSNNFKNMALKMGVATSVVFFSSWLNFPFYESDFGWGKPIWFTNCMDIQNTIVFADAVDGKGVEAWAALSEEVMHKFEQNPEILEHATFVSCA